MIYLILSLAILAIAPLMAKLFQDRSHFEEILSGFLLVVLGGIIFAELLPISYAYAGYWVVPLTLLGLTGPTLIERLFKHAADSTHQITLAIGFSGLLLHTMVDGASLNEFSSIESASLLMPLAIILHRIPVALSVLWIVRPVYGIKGVWLALSGLGIFTFFGFILGVQMESAMNTFSFSLLQAFVSGTLLHVLLHRPHRRRISRISAIKAPLASHSSPIPVISRQSPLSHGHQHKHDHQQNHEDHHDHSHEHHHDHSHDLLAPFKHWGRYQTYGCLLGAMTLGLLAFIH